MLEVGESDPLARSDEGFDGPFPDLLNINGQLCNLSHLYFSNKNNTRRN